MRHCRCRQNRSAESIADALADRGSVADAGTISEEGIFGDAGADADKIEDGNADGDHVAGAVVAGAVAGAVSVADGFLKQGPFRTTLPTSSVTRAVYLFSK